MHPAVETRIESARGCGYRRAGGMYLVCDGPGQPCGMLPIPLRVCPTCRQGIHATRGWTWINGDKFVKGRVCQAKPCTLLCPLSRPPGRVGLIWVGSKFYPRPGDFTREASRMGISRRISAIPKGFIVGQTWIWLAHRQTIVEDCPKCPAFKARKACRKCGGRGVIETPGVFHAFQPSRIEYVVLADDTDEKIEELVERGFTPVRVIRDVDCTPLLDVN